MTEVRQIGLGANAGRTPTNMQMGLHIGKVIAVDQAAKTVDVAMLNGDGTLYGVLVATSMLTTASGTSYLPEPHIPEGGGGTPLGDSKRDMFAIVGFINGARTLPIVLGFRPPMANQLSFPSGEGFENQKLERHEGDRYHRIVGDTVAVLGGVDAVSIEELRFPDNSYLKVFADDKALTNLSGENEHDGLTPFKVKKEERKGFYFQHASGTAILVDVDGHLKVSHQTGARIAIGPDSTDIVREVVELDTVDSLASPPTAADDSPVKISLVHPAGTSLEVAGTGELTIISGKAVGLTHGSGTTIGVAEAGAVTISAISVGVTITGTVLSIIGAVGITGNVVVNGTVTASAYL